MRLTMGVLLGVLWWSPGYAWPPTFRLELPVTPGSVEQPHDVLQRVRTILEQQGARRSVPLGLSWMTDFYRTAEQVEVAASVDVVRANERAPRITLLCIDYSYRRGEDTALAEAVCTRIAQEYRGPDY